MLGLHAVHTPLVDIDKRRVSGPAIDLVRLKRSRLRACLAIQALSIRLYGEGI